MYGTKESISIDMSTWPRIVLVPVHLVSPITRTFKILNHTLGSGTRVLVLRYVHIHATDVSVMAGTDVSVLSDILCIRDPWGKITDASVILVFRIRLS